MITAAQARANEQKAKDDLHQYLFVMSERVIFLDIDGPMIPLRAYFLPGQTPIVSVFDPCAVSLLNKLITDSGAKLVISSTWRRHGRSEVAEVLRKNGVDPIHMHSDWDTPQKMSSSRTDEILLWLRDHPEVTEYVALEDESISVEKAVKCDAYEGFSYRNYLEAQCFLGIPDEDTHEKRQDMIIWLKRMEILRTRRPIDQGHYLTRQASELAFPTNPPFEEDQ